MAAVAGITLVPPDGTVGSEVAAPQASLRGLLHAVVTLHVLTAPSRASRGTHTAEVCDAVDTSTAEGAGGGGAFIYVDATVRTREARRALTHAPVNPVDTAATIVARVRCAIIDVVMAGGAVPPVRA